MLSTLVTLMLCKNAEISEIFEKDFFSPKRTDLDLTIESRKSDITHFGQNKTAHYIFNLSISS